MSVSAGGLLPLGEVRGRLGLVTHPYAGIQSIRVDQILGSLDRTVDFERDFRPRSAT
jgi:hypothetical protein